MKRYAVFALVTMFASSTLFAGNPRKNVGQGPTDTMQQGTTMGPDCSQMNADEQSFASKLTDMNNKKMFCTQFTSQQRQQAMQMMGKPDASGKMMTADQAVQQTMMAPQAQTKPKGGCPVK